MEVGVVVLGQVLLGDGGYMVILQVADAVAERERVTALGVRAVEQKDQPEYKYTHFHPADTAGVLLSLDQTVAPAGTDPKLWWPPAARDWLKQARSDVTNGLGGVEIQCVEPDKAAALWSRILNRPARDDIIRLDDDGEIRFVPIADGRGPGVSAYDVRVVDRDRVIAAAKKRHKQHGVGQEGHETPGVISNPICGGAYKCHADKTERNAK